MVNRTTAREAAMQIVYQMDVRDEYAEAFVDKAIEEAGNLREQKSYVKKVCMAVVENKGMIDNIIEMNVKKWTVARMPKVDLAVLRLAIAEILFDADIPNAVAVNEAVSLAKKFSTEDSGRFINGVLANLM